MATYFEATNLSSSLDAACQAWFVSCYVCCVVFYVLLLDVVMLGSLILSMLIGLHRLAKRFVM